MDTAGSRIIQSSPAVLETLEIRAEDHEHIMSTLQAIQIPHLPQDLAIFVTLYEDLQNAPFLKDQLLAGNSEFEYALIDASMVRPRSGHMGRGNPSNLYQILSTRHALAAVFRAVNDYANNRLKSRNVHSEIVFALSPNNNVCPTYLAAFGEDESLFHTILICERLQNPFDVSE